MQLDKYQGGRMVTFLLSQQNLPYAISLSLVLLLGLLESLSLVIGASLIGLLHEPLHTDDGVQTHKQASPLLRLANWLCIHRLPVLVWFSLALACFAITGLSFNLLSLSMLGQLQPQSISLPIALLVMCFCCHYLGKNIADRLSYRISTVVSIDDLNGCIAKVTFGGASQGFPRAAVVIDKNQQEQQVFVEPNYSGIEFDEGELVVLVARRGRVWLAESTTSLAKAC